MEIDVKNKKKEEIEEIVEKLLRQGYRVRYENKTLYVDDPFAGRNLPSLNEIKKIQKQTKECDWGIYKKYARTLNVETH